jgi:hypothetical protein
LGTLIYFQRLYPLWRWPPLLEEGMRNEGIRLWHAQGLPEGKTRLDLFGLAPRENIGPDLTFVEPIFDSRGPRIGER